MVIETIERVIRLQKEDREFCDGGADLLLILDIGLKSAKKKTILAFT